LINKQNEGLTEEDKILIKNLYCVTGYVAVRLISEVPPKGWERHSMQLGNDRNQHAALKEEINIKVNGS